MKTSPCRPVAAIAVALLPFSLAHSATTFSTLYSFSTQNHDAVSPYAGVLLTAGGSLYGTAPAGGAFGMGAVFELQPPSAPGGAWTESVIYSFQGGADGDQPNGNLVIDKKGVLYGTTTANTGGTGCGATCGTIFELDPPSAPGGAWTETALYRFTGGTDGAGPMAGLVLAPSGALYGTTYAGGGGTCSASGQFAGCGTVFKLSPPPSPGGAWTESILHSFTGQSGDGAYPYAGLVMGTATTLYGTTAAGGANSGGTAFELQEAKGGAWPETVLHSFGAKKDGKSPNQLTVGASGILYGTTAFGGLANAGTVFELAAPSGKTKVWKETVLFVFEAKSGGFFPAGGVAVAASGALYGSTPQGGSNLGGVLFKLSPPKSGSKWTKTVLHNFTGQSGDGSTPEATLSITSKGELYGTTSQGGAGGVGTVFKLTP